MSSTYARFLDALAGAAAIILGATALAVTADVVARNLGIGTLPWIVEVSEYSLPLATFLIAPWLLRRGEHVRLDIVVNNVPPLVARLLEWIADVLGLGFSAIFVVYGIKACLSSARQGSMVLKELVFPEWWLYAPVPICFMLLAIEFARRLRAPGRHPAPAGDG